MEQELNNMPKDKKTPDMANESMTAEEAKAFRASLHVPQPKVLTEEKKREAFRIFWTSNRSKYGKAKSLEKVLWLHLKSIGMNSPEKFVDGLTNFGLKKIK